MIVYYYSTSHTASTRAVRTHVKRYDGVVSLEYKSEGQTRVILGEIDSGRGVEHGLVFDDAITPPALVATTSGERHTAVSHIAYFAGLCFGEGLPFPEFFTDSNGDIRDSASGKRVMIGPIK